MIEHTCLLGTVLLLLQSWLHLRQPKPYMDELFHIPQAINFCTAIVNKSRPTYDGKITTPPGLYIPNAMLSLVFPPDVVCSTRGLRLTNCLFTLFTFVVISNIISLLRTRFNTEKGPDEDVQGHCHHYALALIFIPISFFFSFLYYTDTPSTFYILLAWYFSLINRHASSALTATLATLTRQTNLVWHVFIIFDAFIQTVIPIEPDLKSQTRPGNVINNFGERCSHAIQQLRPHLIPFCLYVIFLYINKGVALGDKERHKETIHHVTIAYFSLFHTVFYLPLQLATCTKPADILKTITHPLFASQTVLKSTFVLSIAISIGLILTTGDYAHPFILSDNRHLTFYIYRRWIRRSAIHRLILAPLYAYAPSSIHVDLLNIRHPPLRLHHFLTDIFIFLCTCAVLLPNPLFEPRYFIVPNLFLTIRRIARAPRQRKEHLPLRICCVSAFYFVMSFGLVFLFAERPFSRAIDTHMPGDDSPGRFMI